MLNTSQQNDKRSTTWLKKSGLLLSSSLVLLMAVPGLAMAEDTMSSQMEKSTMMMTDGNSSDQMVKKALMENIKTSIDVPASYLTNAMSPGPFTAGVNQIIPFELFGGDGMLTRLLLTSSKDAPWSDNGTSMHEALLPFKDLEKGMYYYQVKLDGPMGDLQDKALLDKLQMNGKMTYKAMVEVYAAKDGMPDMMTKVASKPVKLMLNKSTSDEEVKKGLKSMVSKTIQVPRKYVNNAKFPGPFTAGVNETLPLEAFGGDGMLTRLLLTSSKGAKWSDNGDKKHKALFLVKDLEKNKYFYQVKLDGKAGQLEDKALLSKLMKNGKHTYMAEVSIYGSKDGKADMTKVIDHKMVTIKVK